MNVYLNSDNKRFRFVLFYRPEAGFNDFIQEFEEYLGILADCSTPTNICGDINCWTELSNDIYSVKMMFTTKTSLILNYLQQGVTTLM